MYVAILKVVDKIIAYEHFITFEEAKIYKDNIELNNEYNVEIKKEGE